MHRIPPLLFASILLTCLAPLSIAAELQTVEQIEDCVKDNLPNETSRQVVTLVARDRLGEEVVSNAEIFWRKFGEGNRALIRFTAPHKVRGSSLLLIEKDDRADIFMYLPELKKVRRVNQRSIDGAVFGTDFSYEDFERLQGFSEDARSERLPDGEVEGRPAYVLQALPGRADDSQYVRIVSYIDRERCVPMRTELYEKGDRLRKVLTAPLEKQTRESDHDKQLWVPRLVRLDDLVDQSSTELRVEEIETGAKLARKLFSERELARGN